MDDFTIKTSHYVIGAVALVTAISWNNFVKESLHACFPIPKDNLTAQFIYAVITIILLVLVIWLLPDTTRELPSETRERIKQQQHLLRMRQEIHLLNNLRQNLLLVK